MVKFKKKQLGIKRKTQKRVIKKLKKVFPLATIPLNGGGKKLTSI